jgi:hypothetical protein
MPSLAVAGTAFGVQQWPRATLERAIDWEQLSSLNWSGDDRGAAQDVYESTVVFRGVESVINVLAARFQSNREGIVLSAFETPIFAPNVDHTGSITAAVKARPPRRHLAFANPVTGFFEMEVRFRAIAPAILGTTPSLASLRPIPRYQADHSYEVASALTYGQSAIYSDPDTDIGRYVGDFMQTTAEAQAILAYITTTARAAAVSMPVLPGVTYPFGAARGTYPLSCRIKSVGITRHDLRYWMLRIEFVEEVA